jgi:AcrR family transcriptional regulator
MPEDNMGNNSGQRGEPVRQRVIAAAERLLREGRGDFSMRELAAEAGVSFATPFNHLGSKGAIMQALSVIRVDEMAKRFVAALRPTAAADRVSLAIEIAVTVMLEEPGVSRAVMGYIGRGGLSPGDAWARSTELWRLALGDGEGLAADRRDEALLNLPSYLALAFRGALSFWTAGEMPDEALGPHAHAIARALLLGYDGH